MIRPSVGRIVLYHQWNGADPQAAIVTEVHGDTLVNLCAFEGTGSPCPYTSVVLIQPEDDLPAPGTTSYCCWMPYQVGQAQKAEALQAELDAQTEAPEDAPEEAPEG